MSAAIERLGVDTKEKDQIIRQNIDLVQKIARNYSQLVSTHQYEDLVQVGSIGLLNAIDRYDPKHKASFRTYASHLITSEIRHYLRDSIPLVRPPRDLQELLPRVRKTEQALAYRLGREASDEEVARELDIPVDRLEEIRHVEKRMRHMSLDQSLDASQDNSQNFLEQLEDKRYRSFQLVQEDKMLLNDAMASLKTQSRQVIEFAFYHDLTQTEIAKHLGISQMQVSRRLKSAMHELWQTLNTRISPW